MERIDKRNVKGIVCDVIVYICIAISTLPFAEKAYNLLPFYMISEMDINVNSIAVRILLPLATGAIFYFLYSIFVRFVANSLNTRMMLYDKKIEASTVKCILNPIFVGLAIYSGLIEFLFLFYPYAYSTFSTIMKEIGVLIALVIMVKRLSTGLDKIFEPVIAYSMIWPAVLMAVLI